MDPRTAEHAEIIVHHCTGIERGDDVVIKAPPAAEDLVVALHEQIGDRGADPVVVSANGRAVRAFVQACDAEDFSRSGHLLALLDAADVFIGIKGTTNTKETVDVDPEKGATHATVQKPLLDAKMDMRWVGTQYPAPGNAQAAEMSTAAYADFVWNAILRDWDAQRRHQEKLVDILAAADEVRIESGRATDIRMTVDGMTVENDYGEINLPGGEVFTAPVLDSVEGEVRFDKPVHVQGREIQDAWLRFESGTVVEHRATKNEEMLATLLNADAGARRVGELGFGMNRDITRFTNNTLFDEKMGDTLHLALGRAYERTVPDGGERNDSAIHQDMILDVSEESTITVDGETMYSDGSFVFEGDFE